MLLQETISKEEACKQLLCGPSYLLKLRKAGELPYMRHAGKVRYFRDGIDDYIARQKAAAFRKESR